MPLPTCSRVPLIQQDSSIIRDKEIQSDKTDACGRTLAGGVNDIAKQLAGRGPYVYNEGLHANHVCLAADTAGLPTAGADGSVTMTLHQVNGDGAGYVNAYRLVYKGLPLIQLPAPTLATSQRMAQGRRSRTWLLRSKFLAPTRVARPAQLTLHSSRVSPRFARLLFTGLLTSGFTRNTRGHGMHGWSQRLGMPGALPQRGSRRSFWRLRRW